jgi:predicted kinase
VPRLILLNGPPASGKSTLARYYADDHPLTLNLDIDRIRAMIGGWRTELSEAGRLARDIALAAARTHLATGHDVVVPQLVARTEFIARLGSLAAVTGATFHEIFLLPGEQPAIRQYAERARSVAGAVAPDPAISTDRTVAELTQSYRDILRVLTVRPEAAVIRTRRGEIELAYSELLARIA